ncbi:isochorismate synthase [Spirabiliibacterium falconis]|uniref:isochorismate synthase n=1 Tax=Spirabiliibacterium falconis TaxID=572023 RepID=UPI001AAD3E4F|nr:isochorismate synthase [Spirabiliibacterium falconis]MBE2893527.1 isochorismate synthase [Spirabiliibacterium falconis]
MPTCWALLKQAFNTAIIAAENQHDQDYYALTCRVPVTNEDVNVLAWLKGQTCFPQCVWRARHTNEYVVALGQVIVFDDITLAQHFLAQQHELRLIGGMKFDGQAQFLLPRLLLRCSATELQATLCLHADEDKSAVMAWLTALAEPRSITPLDTQLVFHSQAYSQSQWCALVERALQAIASGDFLKVVPAQVKYYTVQGEFNPVDFIAHASAEQRECYGFLWADSPTHAFFGISPERFYCRDGEHLCTEALAGTVKCGQHPQENQNALAWLMKDVKNSHENALVVDDIVQKLTPLAKQITVADLEGRQLRYVQHLARPIRATLKSAVGDCDCMRAIHPSAAVGGLPTAPAKAFLAQHNIERAWYAGTFGVMARQHSEFCVTIRSAYYQQDQISVYAGAGIVRGSDPLLEWQEIERKTAGILSLFRNIRENNDVSSPV